MIGDEARAAVKASKGSQEEAKVFSKRPKAGLLGGRSVQELVKRAPEGRGASDPPPATPAFSRPVPEEARSKRAVDGPEAGRASCAARAKGSRTWHRQVCTRRRSPREIPLLRVYRVLGENREFCGRRNQPKSPRIRSAPIAGHRTKSALEPGRHQIDGPGEMDLL
jgi:hypothetical protein